MFEIISDTEWQLDERVVYPRRDRLLTTSFEIIVERMSAEVKVNKYKRNHVKAHAGARRAVVEIRLSPEVMDLFHNGAGGYRAQFYLGVSHGEAANRYVIDSLLPSVRDAVVQRSKRGCPWGLVKASLCDPDAKAWIHQGLWIRSKKLIDRNLNVERWQHNGTTMSLRKQLLPIWALLTPECETRLQLMGGSVDSKFRSLNVQLKPDRSQELYDLGFT